MPKEKVVICNSTIIIALSSINHISILEKLYKHVIVAEEVYKELLEGKGKPGSNISDKKWIIVASVSDYKLKEYLAFNLDRGEAETIALAEELKADLVLLDDYWARKFAENRKLKISGTIGVLLKAKQKKIIKKIKPLLDKLIQKDFWLTKDLYNEILSQADE